MNKEMTNENSKYGDNRYDYMEALGIPVVDFEENKCGLFHVYNDGIVYSFLSDTDEWLKEDGVDYRLRVMGKYWRDEAGNLNFEDGRRSDAWEYFLTEEAPRFKPDFFKLGSMSDLDDFDSAVNHGNMASELWDPENGEPLPNPELYNAENLMLGSEASPKWISPWN